MYILLDILWIRLRISKKCKGTVYHIFWLENNGEMTFQYNPYFRTMIMLVWVSAIWWQKVTHTGRERTRLWEKGHVFREVLPFSFFTYRVHRTPFFHNVILYSRNKQESCIMLWTILVYFSSISGTIWHIYLYNYIYTYVIRPTQKTHLKSLQEIQLMVQTWVEKRRWLLCRVHRDV